MGGKKKSPALWRERQSRAAPIPHIHIAKFHCFCKRRCCIHGPQRKLGHDACRIVMSAFLLKKTLVFTLLHKFVLLIGLLPDLRASRIQFKNWINVFNAMLFVTICQNTLWTLYYRLCLLHFHECFHLQQYFHTIFICSLLNQRNVHVKHK